MSFGFISAGPFTPVSQPVDYPAASQSVGGVEQQSALPPGPAPVFGNVGEFVGLFNYSPPSSSGEGTSSTESQILAALAQTTSAVAHNFRG